MKTIIFIILLIILSCEKVTPPNTESSPDSVTTPGIITPGDVNTTWTEEFMDLINAHRSSIGLRALIEDEQISAIVREHSQNMANVTTAFGHTGFSTRCSAAKSVLGGGNWCGENVAAGQKTPKDAFNSWMNSSGHRANIEKGQATYTGFGYAQNSSGKYYWTQIFLER